MTEATVDFNDCEIGLVILDREKIKSTELTVDLKLTELTVDLKSGGFSRKNVQTPEPISTIAKSAFVVPRLILAEKNHFPEKEAD